MKQTQHFDLPYLGDMLIDTRPLNIQNNLYTLTIIDEKQQAVRSKTYCKGDFRELLNSIIAACESTLRELDRADIVRIKAVAEFK